MLVLYEIKQEKKYEDTPYKLYVCIGILSKDVYKTIWVKLSIVLNTNLNKTYKYNK